MLAEAEQDFREGCNSLSQKFAEVAKVPGTVAGVGVSTLVQAAARLATLHGYILGLRAILETINEEEKHNVGISEK